MERGGKTVRGSMIEDIRNNKTLQGKTKNEIENLLGKADENSGNWVGYEVVTISRCYFWRCRMEINFDMRTKQVVGDVAVSD
ncbi:MAG TPA: hypothetical protein VF556_07405 [Pyrinomonadaceae bacterium]